MDDLNGSEHRSKTISPVLDKEEKISIKKEGRKKRGKTEGRQKTGRESRPKQRRQNKADPSTQKSRQTTKEKKADKGRKAKEEGQEKRGRNVIHTANPSSNTSKQITALSRSALNSLKIISNSLLKISSVLGSSKDYSQSNLKLTPFCKKKSAA